MTGTMSSTRAGGNVDGPDGIGGELQWAIGGRGWAGRKVVGSNGSRACSGRDLFAGGPRRKRWTLLAPRGLAGASMGRKGSTVSCDGPPKAAGGLGGRWERSRWAWVCSNGSLAC